MLGPDRPLFSLHKPTQLAMKPEAMRQELRKFVARVGGLENARRALELLAALKRAA